MVFVDNEYSAGTKCRKSDSTGRVQKSGCYHMILIYAGNISESQHSTENSKILYKNLDLKQKNWVTMQFHKPGVRILQTSNEILITMTYSFSMIPTLSSCLNVQWKLHLHSSISYSIDFPFSIAQYTLFTYYVYYLPMLIIAISKHWIINTCWMNDKILVINFKPT